MKINRAITIVELLVVIAIIATLAALLYPTLTPVKKKAKGAVCISNLRQCGVVLRMYMSDWGTEAPPATEAAKKAIPANVACCPNDTIWTDHCRQQFGRPLIGSYGYVMDTTMFSDLDQAQAETLWIKSRSPIVMADVFHGPVIVEPTHDAIDWSKVNKNPLEAPQFCIPPSWLALMIDGSVKNIHWRRSASNELPPAFQWNLILVVRGQMDDLRMGD